MKMLIATGGTGGHIYPAIALANAAKKLYPSINILFIGNSNRMEASVVPQNGYEFIGINASGLSGNIVKKGKAIFQTVFAYQAASKIIKKFHPDIAIGFGGYVSAPIMFAAYRLKCPTLIHEQNSIVGLANRMVEKYMNGVIVCYERCLTSFNNRDVRYYGNPRESEAARAVLDKDYYQALGLDFKKPCIMIVMGSLGSSTINEVVKETLPLINADFQICWVVGKNQDLRMLPKFKDNVFVFNYVDQIKIMPQIDLIVCRSGATTIAEICAVGVPSILIPSPYVANNHQFYNASVLSQQGAAQIIEERDLKPDSLANEIMHLMNDTKKRKNMKMKAKLLAKENASNDIIKWCLDLVEGRSVR